MPHTTQNGSAVRFNTVSGFRLPTDAAITDAGQVRVGGFGPMFRLAGECRGDSVGAGPVRGTPALSDAGTVRVGGFGPVFRLAGEYRGAPVDAGMTRQAPALSDAGVVRVGGFGPLFR